MLVLRDELRSSVFSLVAQHISFFKALVRYIKHEVYIFHVDLSGQTEPLLRFRHLILHVSYTSRDIGSRFFVYTPTPGTLTFSLPALTSKYSVLTIKIF